MFLSVCSASRTSWLLAARVSTTASCIAIRARPSIIWRRILLSCFRLSPDLFHSSSNNLCNDARVAASCSTRSFSTNLATLRLLTNWAVSSMDIPRPVPEAQCATSQVLVQRAGLLGCFYGVSRVANSTRQLNHTRQLEAELMLLGLRHTHLTEVRAQARTAQDAENPAAQGRWPPRTSPSRSAVGRSAGPVRDRPQAAPCIPRAGPK